MKINGINPESGEEFQVEAENVDREFLESMSVFENTDAEVRRIIDNLNVSADAKSLLYSFSSATIKAGEFIVKIGRKIIDYICRVFSEHPSATFGAVFGAIAGFLIFSIPLLGVVLGPLLAPIAIAFGMFGGLREDLKDKALARKIAEINAKFAPLNANANAI